MLRRRRRCPRELDLAVALGLLALAMQLLLPLAHAPTDPDAPAGSGALDRWDDGPSVAPWHPPPTPAHDASSCALCQNLARRQSFAPAALPAGGPPARIESPLPRSNARILAPLAQRDHPPRAPPPRQLPA